MTRSPDIIADIARTTLQFAAAALVPACVLILALNIIGA